MIPFTSDEAKANAEQLKVSNNVRNLTRITLFSVNEIQSTYRDYLDFSDHDAVDSYLLAHTRVQQLDLINFSHQSEDMPIRFPKILENIQTYNYIRVENYWNLGIENSTIFYAKINDFKYLNEGTTLINFTKDVFTTWLPNRNLKPINNTPVERGHINDLQDNGTSIYQANINGEEISATTTLQTAYIDNVKFNFPNASASVSWAVWQVMKNWGTDSPTSPFDGQTPSQLSAPNILYYLIIPFNPISQQTYPFECDGVTIPAQGSLNDLAITIGTDGNLVSSMQFVSGFSSEDLGFNFTLDNSTVKVTDNTLKGHSFSATGPAGSFSLFRVSSVASAMKTWDTNVSPYSLVRSKQDQLIKNAGLSYVIRNVKTSYEPFSRIDISDGFGGFASYNPALINYTNPNTSLKFKRMGSLGLSNKVFTGIDNYKVLAGQPNDGTSQYRNLLFQNGIFQTEGREIPIISDTYTSTNALNQNRNAMVQTNAQLSVTNNNIANANAKRNNQNSIAATNSQLKNTQLNEKAQRDIRTGANIVEGVGDAFGVSIGSDSANMLAGTLGGATTGAAGGIGAGLGGAIGGMVSGALKGGFNAAQSNNAINQNQATQSANQAIANKLSQKTTDNNIQTSQKIAANNYENVIANFNAGQADLKNSPDTIIQQAGNIYFAYQSLNYLTMFSVLTETVDRIIQTDMYFTMFGYTLNKWFSSQDFMNLVNSRSRFNYIRVATIKFNSVKSNLNIPIKDLEQIEAAYTAGITIWHDYENIYNYDLENKQKSVNYVSPGGNTNLLQIQNMLATKSDYQALMAGEDITGKFDNETPETTA